MVECADSFFDRRVPVWAMGIDQVYVGKAEALKREVQAFDYVFPGEADVVDAVGAVSTTPVDLDAC